MKPTVSDAEVLGAKTLYHGSKSGLVGPIRPASRDCCDFGSGFYMGDSPLQPQTLICRMERPWFYTLAFDMNGLVVSTFSSVREWALFIAYNRGAMAGYAGTPLEARMKAIVAGKDVLFGRIANDRVFYAAQRFFEGDITLEALADVLKALNYGNQYVALTERACSRVGIRSARVLSAAECDSLRQKSERQRAHAENQTNEILKAHRHQDGTFFDEICERLAAGEETL